MPPKTNLTPSSSRNALGIPREGVPSGVTTGNAFFFRLKKDPSGALILGPKSAWKVAIWPLAIAIPISLCDPLRRLVFRIVTFGDSTFNYPFFFDGFEWMTLWIGFGISAMLFLFYIFVNQWTLTTRFDQAQNVIHRQQNDPKLLRVLFGLHWRVDEFRMKVRDARAVQLCYGGYSKGDSESPGYDWWQLLIVGQGEPPFRAIIAQSAARQKLSDTGQKIAAYLSVPWVDDGDFRASGIDISEMAAGRLDPQGVYITAGSTEDPPINPQTVIEAVKRRRMRGEKPFLLLVAVTALFAAFVVWKLIMIEEEDAKARLPAPPPPGPAVSVDLDELLHNGSKYHGKKIRTTGYLRFITFLMNHYGEGKHLTFYALSPEPLDLSKLQKGGTIGNTSITNVLVQTLEFMDGRFIQGAQTNITPKRTIVGSFVYSEGRHTLTMSHWAPGKEDVNQGRGEKSSK